MDLYRTMARATRRIRPPRPWDLDREGQPPAVGPGLVVGPPDFIGIGTQKAGTSWWYTLMCQHPDIHHEPAIHKERHFFERYWNRPFDSTAVERYHAWFPRPPGSTVGEWTPGYLARPWVPELLRLAAPDARLVVMLRDPVRRLKSGLRHHLRAGTELTPWLISDALERGRYGEQLDRLMSVIDRQQVLILQYEQCTSDTTARLQETFEFIGVSPVPIDVAAVGRVNSPVSGPIDFPPHFLEAARSIYASDRPSLEAHCTDFDFDLW